MTQSQKWGVASADYVEDFVGKPSNSSETKGFFGGTCRSQERCGVLLHWCQGETVNKKLGRERKGKKKKKYKAF